MTAPAATAPALMTEREAEVITEQIVGRLDQVAENIEAVQSLMRDALQRQAHLALGYTSPTAYMRDRFEGALVNLSAALRREIVQELSDAGMSTRAIAPIFGVSQKTIVKDSQVIPEVSPASDLEEPQAQDEGEVTAPVEETPRAVTADPVTGEVIEDEPEAPRVVVGLDGKNYPAPTAAPRRRSLVDDAFTANTALWRAVEAIRSITNDDRYTRNKADILAALQPSADLARQILADLYTSPDKEN